MSKLTRRAFIGSTILAGGVLAIGIGLRPGHRTKKLAELFEGPNETLINMWIKIFPDNSIRMLTPHVEMGQGANTTLAMMLADELDADWDTVSIEQAPAHEAYANFHLVRDFALPSQVPALLEDTVDGAFGVVARQMSLQITGGSLSVRATGERGMRTAGAATRALFVEAAASEWSVPSSEITVENSYVLHYASDRREPFIHFAEKVASQRGDVHPTLKTPDQYKLMGTDVPRLDIPEKVDGTALFGVDVDLPGMKYATVQAAPVFGSSVSSFDGSKAESMPGVDKVVNLGTAVAVIADSYWTAKKALDKVDIVFSKTDKDAYTSAEIFSQQAASLDNAIEAGDTKVDFSFGDVDSVFESSENILEVEYRLPVLAHTCMEPMNCTALVTGDSIELWGGFQDALRIRNHMVTELDFAADKVKVNTTYLGGGFGRRAKEDYPEQAAKLATEMPGTPIKMIWSREEDVRHDFYRTQSLSRLKAVVQEQDGLVAWEQLFVDKHEPVEAPELLYRVPNQLVHYVQSPSHVPFGAWRSVDHSQHAFFIESFVDEVAVHANQDPYEFRRQLLSDDSRSKRVLEKVAEMSSWGKSLPPAHGQGIAIHKAFGTIVAEVVEVDMSSGKPKIKNVYCAADPGFAMHPSGFVAQMESGIIFALTSALYGEIEIERGAVKQSNFHDYRMLRMDEAPKIEVAVINGGGRLGGAGEPATPPASPALTNAIFAATGKRIRELPISRHDHSYG